MRILIDIDKCIGAGQCVRAAEDVFAQDDDTGLVILLQDKPNAERREAVMTAARVCPVAAILVED